MYTRTPSLIAKVNQMGCHEEMVLRSIRKHMLCQNSSEEEAETWALTNSCIISSLVTKQRLNSTSDRSVEAESCSRQQSSMLWECQSAHICFSPLCPSEGAIDMQRLGLEEHLLCTNLLYCTNSLFVIPGKENTAAQKWAASIEMLFQATDTDGEVFSAPPEPTTHPELPYVFAKALSQCHWLSIQSIEPQCLLFISCLEGLTGYTDKTLIKTSSVTSCDLKAAPSVGAIRHVLKELLSLGCVLVCVYWGKWGNQGI